MARDACDYLSLYTPDLIAEPWERCESEPGYRLARPRYSGPHVEWERGRVWGSQDLGEPVKFVRQVPARGGKSSNPAVSGNDGMGILLMPSV